MRTATVAVILLMVACASAAAAPLAGRVVHVVDGDTLDVLTGEKRVRVRLSEIDAPESRQGFGHRSRQSLIQVCGGEIAALDISGKDRNGRTIARVVCNGTDASAEQARRVWRGCLIDTPSRNRRCIDFRRKRGQLTAASGETASRCHHGSSAAIASLNAPANA
jgi:endonuclease YncB( thermonuclease family)